MCGIAGIWGDTETSAVPGMMDRQLHRGPDGDGIYRRQGTGALGHVRLSIIDPEAGAQPIFSEDASKILVANGEIYNHQHLRSHVSLA